MKPLALAICLALVAPPPEVAAAAKPAASTPGAPAWVSRSNEFVQILLNAQGPFQPELESFFERARLRRQGN